MYQVTLEALQNSCWEEAINGCENPINYPEAIEAFLTNNTVDDSERRALIFLAHLCGIHLRYDESDPQYVPLFISKQGRCLTVEEIPVENLEILYEFAKGIQNEFIVSRFMDFVWIHKHKKYRYEAAKRAIRAYINLAKNEKIDVFFAVPYLLRASNILSELGKCNDEILNEVSTAFENFSCLFSEQQLDSLHRPIFAMMAKRKYGDQYLLYKKMINTMEYHRDSNRKSYHLARAFLEVAISFAGNLCSSTKKIKSFAKKIKSLRMLNAKLYFEESRVFDNFWKIILLEKSLNEYRNLQCASIAEKVHKEILRQEKSPEKLFPERNTHQIDLTKIVSFAELKVSGNSLNDVFLNFINITDTYEYEKYREEAIRNSRNSLVNTICPQKVFFNQNTKLVHKAQSLTSSENDDKEKIIESLMFENLHYYIPIKVRGIILPALNVILKKHFINKYLIADIIRQNPLIPNDRHPLYLQGLMAGFNYDFVTAAHFLVFQLENSIRLAFEREGMIVSSVSNNGIQKEQPLQTLLYHDNIYHIFPVNYVHLLRCLLIAQNGFNLRNNIAHGLIGFEHLQSDASVFLWWFTLRLVCTHFR